MNCSDRHIRDGGVLADKSLVVHSDAIPLGGAATRRLIICV